MQTPYTQLNKKLKNEIADLKKQIRKQKNLLEFAGGGGIGGNPEGSGIDPAYNPADPNKGYVAGLAVGAGANADAIIANPAIIQQTAITKAAQLAGVQLGAFNFSGVPTKPHFSSNIGSGLGFGVDNAAFERAKEIVNRYAPNEANPYQNLDSQELGYLAWSLLNKANAVQGTETLRNTLRQWGLDSEDLGTYQIPQQQQQMYGQPDAYSTQEPGVAFARKIQKMEKKSENKDLEQSEQNFGRKVNNIVKSKISRNTQKNK